MNRLLHAKESAALLCLFRPLSDIAFAQPVTTSIVDSLHFAERFMWLVPDIPQRALFNSISLLCSGEGPDTGIRLGFTPSLKTFISLPPSVFRKEYAVKSLLRNTFSQWGAVPRWFLGLNSLPDVAVPDSSTDEDDEAIYAKRSSICASALVLLWTHLLYSPDFPKTKFTARPPIHTPPPLSGVHRNWLSPSSFPLSSLKPSATSWTGYYSLPMGGKLRITAPMTITLMKKQGSDASSDSVVVFEGTGLDAIEAFCLTGTISEGGVVRASKSYENGPQWNWNGMVLPWALVGIWGNKNSWGGWWWIWPSDEY